MRFRVLASDYDDTLASRGIVAPETMHSLERLRDNGGHLVLVTGRILPDIFRLFPRYRLSEWIVAENGALLFHPESGTQTLLAASAQDEFVQTLEERIGPLYKGHVMFATAQVNEAAVLETAQEFGLDLEAIYNKGAAMFLPRGIDKASGLAAVARCLNVPLSQMVGIGDAENDQALLSACGYSVAVANALPILKARADWTTAGDHGRGVMEVIDRMLADELPVAVRANARLA